MGPSQRVFWVLMVLNALDVSEFPLMPLTGGVSWRCPHFGQEHLQFHVLVQFVRLISVNGNLRSPLTPFQSVQRGVISLVGPTAVSHFRNSWTSPLVELLIHFCSIFPSLIYLYLYLYKVQKNNKYGLYCS